VAGSPRKRAKREAAGGGQGAAGSPERGEGSPKARVPRHRATADALATTDSGPGIIDLDASSVERVPSPEADGSPDLDLPGPQPYDSGTILYRDIRPPSVKDAGRGPDGKVIPHERDEEVARRVAKMAGEGATLNFIAVVLNLRPGVLKKHYHNELTYSEEAANLEVVAAAHRMATDGEHEGITKFWLKARNKWRDGDTAEDKGNSLFNIHIHA
jgi:hypothetical protein